MLKTLTVFTPTFNRAYCLHQLYESLCRQTSNDFEWLIIDDGSTDHTKALVERWIKEDKVKIHYEYKQNGGMHTGHNKAYELIETELNVCIDSDDYMPDNAVQNILKKWQLIENKEKIAGIIGLDAFKDGKIVGTKIPSFLKQGSLYQLYNKYGVKGDKKLILRTEVVNKYPAYPQYPNEKLVPLGILYLMIGNDYDFLYSNEVYCIVEYQEDGSSKTIFKQYKESPRGFAYARLVHLKHSTSFLHLFKTSIHLVSSAIFSKDVKLILMSNRKLITLFSLPFGLLLNIYISFILFFFKNENNSLHK